MVYFDGGVEDGVKKTIYSRTAMAPTTELDVNGYSFSYTQSFGDESLITKAKETADRLAIAGRAHWTELYTYVHTPEQLADWETRIPNFGCSCQRDYQELKATFPPQYHDDELGWLKFEWKSGIHNLVNRKLGKPEKSIEDATKEWLSIDAPKMHQPESF